MYSMHICPERRDSRENSILSLKAWERESYIVAKTRWRSTGIGNWKCCTIRAQTTEGVYREGGWLTPRTTACTGKGDGWHLCDHGLSYSKSLSVNYFNTAAESRTRVIQVLCLKTCGYGCKGSDIRDTSQRWSPLLRIKTHVTPTTWYVLWYLV